MMRRHAALFRAEVSENDPDEELWVMAQAENESCGSPQRKDQGMGLYKKAKQAIWGSLRSILNLQISGTTTL